MEKQEDSKLLCAPVEFRYRSVGTSVEKQKTSIFVMHNLFTSNQRFTRGEGSAFTGTIIIGSDVNLSPVVTLLLTFDLKRVSYLLLTLFPSVCISIFFSFFR